MTDTTRRPHDPTEAQQKSLLWMLNADSVGLCRMKHKTTGEWRTVIMVADRAINGGMMTYPVGIMMEAEEMKTCLDDYELPDHARRETEDEFSERKASLKAGMVHAPDDTDPTEAVLDRVFPNRKKD